MQFFTNSPSMWGGGARRGANKGSCLHSKRGFQLQAPGPWHNLRGQRRGQGEKARHRLLSCSHDDSASWILKKKPSLNCKANQNDTVQLFLLFLHLSLPSFVPFHGHAISPSFLISERRRNLLLDFNSLVSTCRRPIGKCISPPLNKRRIRTRSGRGRIVSSSSRCLLRVFLRVDWGGAGEFVRGEISLPVFIPGMQGEWDWKFRIGSLKRE